MIEAISKSMIEWNQVVFLRPANECIARIDRCFTGMDVHSIYLTKISLQDRVLNLLSGLVLLIPPFSFIAWIFMKTFGNAEDLAPPIPHSSVQAKE